MSQIQLYSKVQVIIGNSLGTFQGNLSEYADVKITRNSGLLPVDTAAKGFAGFTPGAPFLEIEVGNAVPNADFEYNSGSDQIGGAGGVDVGPNTQAIPAFTPIQMTLVAAGRTLTSDGCIMSDDLSYAINSEAKLNFRFRGEWADWI